MATSQVDIFNWALSIVGARESVSTVDDDGRENEVCKLWYAIVRDTVLRAAPWPSARKVGQLALLSTAGETWLAGKPHPGYRFAYAVPTDMIRPRWLSDFAPFTTGLLDDNQQAVMTNAPQAVLVYTMRQENPAAWEPDLALAIAHGLAAYICAPLNAKYERIDFALQTANNALIEARLSAANQDMEYFDTTPDWLLARGYADPGPNMRFIYPNGQLLAPPSGWKSSK